jgi:hypothetical protein
MNINKEAIHGLAIITALWHSNWIPPGTQHERWEILDHYLSDPQAWQELQENIEGYHLWVTTDLSPPTTTIYDLAEAMGGTEDEIDEALQQMDDLDNLEIYGITKENI